MNDSDSSATPLPESNLRLASLSDAVRANLFTLRHPETDWMPHLLMPDGSNLVYIIIVSAGQGGLPIAGTLIKECVTNVLVINRESSGAEGIWKNYGRMPIIRSPKHYPGANIGIRNLPCEAWHRAVFGGTSQDSLRSVPINNWSTYLNWVRQTLEISIQNNTELIKIEHYENTLKLSLKSLNGIEIKYTRRLLLATGHDGTGEWWSPDYLRALPERLQTKASGPVEFNHLEGKKVAILGVGLTAGDSAICALEAGVEVHMFCRKTSHRRQQVYRWCITAGFLRHFRGLDDATRWRCMHYILNTRMACLPRPGIGRIVIQILSYIQTLTGNVLNHLKKELE